MKNFNIMSSQKPFRVQYSHIFDAEALPYLFLWKEIFTSIPKLAVQICFSQSLFCFILGTSLLIERQLKEKF